MPHHNSAARRHGFHAPHGSGKVAELPKPVMIWTRVFPGLDLPLQAVKNCYEIPHLSCDVLYEVLNVPSHDANEVVAWDYNEKLEVLHTTNIRIAKILKRRGFAVNIKPFTVGLVYSEVMAELQKSSYATFKRFTALVDRKVTFTFRKGVSMSDALKAVEQSKAIPHNEEPIAVTIRNGAFSCKSLRTALELVNITAQLPTIELKGHAFAA